MKKIVTVLVVVMGLVMAGNSTKAQGKIGYVSLQELVPSMPEYKKADTAMNDFQSALGQQFDDMRREFNEQDSLLNAKDTGDAGGELNKIIDPYTREIADIGIVRQVHQGAPIQHNRISHAASVRRNLFSTPAGGRNAPDVQFVRQNALDEVKELRVRRPQWKVR